MQINIIAGAGASSEPGLIAGAQYVANLMDTLFTANVTINVTVTFGPGNGIFSNGLGAGSAQGVNLPYSTVRAALIANEQSQQQSQAYGTLPTSDFLPTAAPPGSPPSNDVYVAPGQAELLGLGGVSGPININLNINSASNLTMAFTPGYVSPVYGGKDAIDGMFHEITETAMGRIGDVGGNGAYSVLDLFRFTPGAQPPVRDVTLGTPGSNSSAYFSIDNGVTNLGAWNNISTNGYDLGDWVGNPGGAEADALGAATDGLVNPVSPQDLTLMNVLGWNLNPGRTVEVATGQTSAGLLVVGSRGQLIVDAGGAANSASYTAGGVGLVFGVDSGAVAYGTGLEYVFSGGVASGTVIGNVGSQVVDGGASFNTFVGSGGIETVEFGGFIGQTPGPGESFNTLVDGAEEEIGSGGISFSTVVSGTPATPAAASGGGTLRIDSGGDANVTTVDSGGAEVVAAGGVANSTTVSSGGLETVSGTDSGATILKFGFQTVANAGTASGAVVSKGGTQTIDGGGKATGTVVFSGGVEEVLRFGSASNSIISNGGHENVFGSDTSTTVSMGGTQTISNHGSASYALIVNGGIENVDSAGAAFGAMVSSGGHLVVSSGGAASGASVLKGGSESVSGADVSATVSGSGVQTVYSGGATTGTMVRTGGIENIYVGGVAGDVVVFAGGAENVYGGDSHVSLEGGTQTIYGGGTASDTSVSAAGHQAVQAGGTSLSATIVKGSELVYGSAVSTTVDKLGSEFVYAGVARDSKLNGGTAVVAGGAAVGTIIRSGAVQTVYSGGLASGTIVSSGSEELGDGFASGGVDIGTIVDGGFEIVQVGGTASNTILNSGGSESVYSGGSALGATVNAHAAQTLKGFASGAILNSGGDQYVEPGGEAFDSVISGGLIEVSSGGGLGSDGGDGPTFAAGAGGILRIDNANDYLARNGSNPVGGFGALDQIDFADVAFGSQTTLAFQQENSRYGYLSVGDGAHNAAVALLGQYSVANFTSGPDHFGGTLIDFQATPSFQQMRAASPNIVHPAHNASWA